jgi:hypothetical protein
MNAGRSAAGGASRRTLSDVARSRIPSSEWPISCRSTSDFDQDLAISHRPLDLIGCDKDCDKLQFAQNAMGYSELPDADKPICATPTMAGRCTLRGNSWRRACTSTITRRVSRPWGDLFPERARTRTADERRTRSSRTARGLITEATIWQTMVVNGDLQPRVPLSVPVLSPSIWHVTMPQVTTDESEDRGISRR